MTTASLAASPEFRDNRLLQIYCAVFAAAVAIAAYHPDTAFDFALENAVVFVFVTTLVFTYERFRFSDLSYLLIFIYLCLHEYGAHYKYSDVPVGEWLKPLLHTKRNHYDRIAHFSFGFLLAYPMREVAIRSLRVSGRWVYYLPVECTLAFSAIYEIFEAIAANLLTPERGEEFVGMQGDIWDSQQDMFMAAAGSVAAVLLISAMARYRKAALSARESAGSLTAVH